MDNPSAFPEVPADVNAYEGRSGMTLRDWFAGQALAGLLALPEGGAGEARRISEHQEHFAAVSYGYADAMLRARSESST